MNSLDAVNISEDSEDSQESEDSEDSEDSEENEDPEEYNEQLQRDFPELQRQMIITENAE